MIFKNILEQELKKIGFEKIFYSTVNYNEVVDAPSLVGNDYYKPEEIEILLSELDKGKFCLVQNIILDKKIISASVSFVCTQENGEEIMNNLYDSQLITQITPINDLFSCVLVNLIIGEKNA